MSNQKNEYQIIDQNQEVEMISNSTNDKIYLHFLFFHFIRKIYILQKIIIILSFYQ